MDALDRALRRFNERAVRPPGVVAKAILVLLAVALPAWLWTERGAAVGLVAAAVYGSLFLLGAFRHDRLRAWSRAHPILDLLWLPPLAFLAFAGLTELSLPVCVVLSLALAAAVVALRALVEWRRRSSPT